MEPIEYKTIAQADSLARMLEQLNELGAQGWEVLCPGKREDGHRNGRARGAPARGAAPQTAQGVVAVAQDARQVGGPPLRPGCAAGRHVIRLAAAPPLTAGRSCAPCRNAVMTGPTSCALSSRARCPPPFTSVQPRRWDQPRHYPVVHVRCHRVVVPAQEQRVMPDQRQVRQAGPPGHGRHAEPPGPPAVRLGHGQARGQFRLRPHLPAEHGARTAGEPVGMIAARVHHVQQRRRTAGHGHARRTRWTPGPACRPARGGTGPSAGRPRRRTRPPGHGRTSRPADPERPRRYRPGPASTSARTAPRRSRRPAGRR